MNEADLRYLKQLLAEGRNSEALFLINRRLEALRDEKHYSQFKDNHELKP